MSSHHIAAALLIVLSGCEDGVGQPIYAKASSGIGASPSATGGGMGTTYPKSLGGAAGSGGKSATTVRGGAPSATSTSPDLAALDCSSMDEWPAEWTLGEDNMLTLLNVVREAGFPCLTSESSEAIAAPAVTMAETLRCAARMHSDSQFGGGGAAARIVRSGFPANRIAEVVFATDQTDATAAAVLTTLLLSDNQTDCNSLMDARFTSVGIGFAEVSGSAYWTIDLASE